jgi:Protein of unknown function (DUF3572)
VKPPQQNTLEISTITLNLIAFIASDESRLERFLALSGLALNDLKQGAANPEFQGFVLDYALQDETLILDFAATSGNKPETIQRARLSLPGATYDF